ncbi:MAG: RNA polymerase sigma factor [Pseudomonadota bacterium]
MSAATDTPARTAAHERSRAADAADVARPAGGAVDALRDLYDRYGAIAFGFALRLVRDHGLAEECVQDAFVALWRNAARFDPDRARLSTWLLTVVRNRGVELLRARAARPADLRADLGDTDDVDPGPADAAAAAERARVVADALAALPEPQLAVVRLAYFDGLSHGEIANRLGLPLGTVKGRLRLGLERLRPFVDPLRPEAAA